MWPIQPWTASNHEAHFLYGPAWLPVRTCLTCVLLFCRAEATDVANAVLDGVDCIMLGAETLRGKHPVATVETILHICKQAEKVFDHDYHFETLMRVSPAPPLPLCPSSRQSSYNFHVEEKKEKTRPFCVSLIGSI